MKRPSEFRKDRIPSLRSTIAALVLCAFALPAQKARAATIVVNDEPSCAAIGGLFVAQQCRFYNPTVFTVAAGDVVQLGVGLTAAFAVVHGRLEVGDRLFWTFFDVVNNGTITVAPGGEVSNRQGTFVNNGTIKVDCGGTASGPITGNPVNFLPCPASCTMGAGIPQTLPKPPKKAGLVKITKGLTTTPASKTTKFKISGTLENCQNFPTVPDAAGPITGGSFKLTLEVPPGSTCADISSGLPVKSSLSITWNTPDLSKPGKFKKVGSEKTTLAGFAQPGADPIVLTATGQDFGTKSKVPGFVTRHAVLTMTMDQTAAEIAMGCADPKKGLAVLDFTGANGSSTLVIP